MQQIEILGAWEKVVDTPSVNPHYFLQYQNLKGATNLVTRVALNLQPLFRAFGHSVGSEKKFYFCVGCKKQDQAKMQAIFNRYNSQQVIETTSLSFENEIGFISWMLPNEEAKKTLADLFQTLCSADKLGEPGVPEVISKLFKERIEKHLPQQVES